MQEPSRQQLLAYEAGGETPARIAHVIATEQTSRNPIELDVQLNQFNARVLSMKVNSSSTESVPTTDCYYR